VKNLALGLKRNTSIVHLHLGGNNITGPGIEPIFKVITKSNFICSLDLGNRKGSKHYNKLGI
jgi:hypothetical protein